MQTWALARSYAVAFMPYGQLAWTAASNMADGWTRHWRKISDAGFDAFSTVSPLATSIAF